MKISYRKWSNDPRSQNYIVTANDVMISHLLSKDDSKLLSQCLQKLIRSGNQIGVENIIEKVKGPVVLASILNAKK